MLEEQKAAITKEASDLRTSLREVEKARLEARRELQELRRQVKLLDGERNKLGSEVNELQTRVARDEEKEEESRKENFGLKQVTAKYNLKGCSVTISIDPWRQYTFQYCRSVV